MWTHGEGLWVTAWSTEIRHISKAENINSSPLSLFSKADKFFQLTFLGMSCGYHFIIIGNHSTALKKKPNRNYKGRFKLTPDCKCISIHDGLIWDMNPAEGLTPITDSTNTRGDLLISDRYLCVRFTLKTICSLWLLSPAETGPKHHITWWVQDTSAEACSWSPAKASTLRIKRRFVHKS